ncbi:retrovirus-related pol polyprotein from transposon TNT 1-94, partial [Tanacetum coccineum]
MKKLLKDLLRRICKAELEGREKSWQVTQEEEDTLNFHENNISSLMEADYEFSFTRLQAEKEQDSFIPMDSEVVEGSKSHAVKEKVMEFESAQSNTTAKLPILKLENGNSWVFFPHKHHKRMGTSVTDVSTVTAIKKKGLTKKNDVKARNLAILALPNQTYLLVNTVDAKQCLCYRNTIGGNEATKKKHKILLKQQYENFSASSTESLDSIFNRFVKKYVGAQNLAFITAPSTSSTNDVNTARPAYEVSTVSPNVNTASPQVSTASFSDNAVYAFMVENPNGSNILQYFQRTCKKFFINANDIAGYDKSNVECFNCHKMRHFARECRAPRNKEGQFRNQDNTRKHGNNEDTSSKVMLAIDGVGFDWSEMAEDQVQTNMALMAFSDSECDDLIAKLNQTEFTAATYKRGLATLEEQLITYRKNEVLFSEEVTVLKRE